jgi:hypothetical protein
MGSVSSAFKKIIKVGIADPLGSITGANAAARAAAQLNSSLQQQQTAAMNLQKNMAADLRNTEVADVQAAGTADAATELLKKRRQGGGLASTLGL